MKTKVTEFKAKKKDHDLLKKIQARIRWDIRVSNSDILIETKNGDVTLGGYFDKPYRHSAAVDIIRSTEGVTKLNDNSQIVGGYFRSDRKLESLISKQLLTLSLAKGEWVDVEVQNGVAKLEGCVFRPHLKAFAARATWELSGIRDCINLIALREPDNKSSLASHFSPVSRRFDLTDQVTGVVTLISQHGRTLKNTCFY